MHLRTARRQQCLLADPPDIAPERRSETNGHVPKIGRCAGFDRVDIDNARQNTPRLPALWPLPTGQGLSRPRLTGREQKIGHAAAHQLLHHWQDSCANFIGGTTQKQFELETNGRARHCSSPPAIRCSISRADGM